MAAGGREEGGRALPSPREAGGGTLASLLRGHHHLQGRGWEAEGRTGRKPPGWFSGVGAASGCHVTPRPHTPLRFSRVEEEAPAQPAGAPLPGPVPHQRRRPLPGCHTPSPEKTLLSPAARQAPFCLGGKHLPPLRLHTTNPSRLTAGNLPPSTDPALKLNVVKKSV